MVIFMALTYLSSHSFKYDYFLYQFMTQLWLIPVDERSFQRTLNQKIDVSDRDEKPNRFPDQARVWGVRTDQEQGDWERNRRNFDRMETGDPLLVYRNKTSQYHAKG